MTTTEPDFTADPTALWASAQVTALLGEQNEPAPEYGSPAWARLRAADPRRAAAIITAAEQWRRHTARTAWLDQLLEEDPERWFAVVTADADDQARRLAPMLARRPTNTEQAFRRRYGPVRPVRAVPGWPVAIPGRPGWWRHCIDGQQTDLPHSTLPGQETAA
ncbi:hypothetical protein GCM10010420_39300 [Streptomyces glaucosporus]|uniref:Uncharacterized protein n=1 Tax=Streptomyces glaucosporus TaxID=284044 RepID=A0ABP5VMZ0_9ACTN